MTAPYILLWQRNGREFFEWCWTQAEAERRLDYVNRYGDYNWAALLRYRSDPKNPRNGYFDTIKVIGEKV